MLFSAYKKELTHKSLFEFHLIKRNISLCTQRQRVILCAILISESEFCVCVIRDIEEGFVCVLSVNANHIQSHGRWKECDSHVIYNCISSSFLTLLQRRKKKHLHAPFSMIN